MLRNEMNEEFGPKTARARMHPPREQLDFRRQPDQFNGKGHEVAVDNTSSYMEELQGHVAKRGTATGARATA